MDQLRLYCGSMASALFIGFSIFQGYVCESHGKYIFLGSFVNFVYMFSSGKNCVSVHLIDEEYIPLYFIHTFNG